MRRLVALFRSMRAAKGVFLKAIVRLEGWRNATKRVCGFWKRS